jgi:hypothetical protein
MHGDAQIPHKPENDFGTQLRFSMVPATIFTTKHIPSPPWLLQTPWHYLLGEENH